MSASNTSTSPTNRVVTVKRAKSHDDVETNRESAAYLKRREQVRRAQRNHRERKENYIKALEDEVFQLKTNERKIVKENEALNTEVAQLRVLIKTDVSTTWSQSDWNVCDDAWMNPSTANAMSLYGVSVGDDFSKTSWHFASPGPGNSSALVASSAPSTMPMRSCPPAFTYPTSDTRPKSPAHISSVNHTDLAIDFVMTLEKPCLNRATSAILDLGQPAIDQPLTPPRVDAYHAFLEERFLKPGVSSESTSSEGLEKLLALASTFKLANQITPIQAWQEVVSHPDFGCWGIAVLRRLVEELLWHVKCYGFGAVIETSIFKMLIDSAFTVSGL